MLECSIHYGIYFNIQVSYTNNIKGLPALQLTLHPTALYTPSLAYSTNMLAQIGECNLWVIQPQRRHDTEGGCSGQDFCDSNCAKFMPSGRMLVILLPDKL